MHRSLADRVGPYDLRSAWVHPDLRVRVLRAVPTCPSPERRPCQPAGSGFDSQAPVPEAALGKYTLSESTHQVLSRKESRWGWWVKSEHPASGGHGQWAETGSHSVAARGGGHWSVPSPLHVCKSRGRRGARPGKQQHISPKD